MFRLTLKEIAAKKLRLVTTAIAVMLGVAFMAGTFVFTATLSNTFDGLVTDAYSGTDAVVRGASDIDAPFGTPTPRLDATLVATLPTSTACRQPRISGYAQLIDAKGDPTAIPVRALHTRRILDRDPAAQPMPPRRGNGPGGPRADRDRSSLGKHRAHRGRQHRDGTDEDRSRSVHRHRNRRLRRRLAGGASAVLFTPADAQGHVTEPGSDSILLVGDTGLTQDELVTRRRRCKPTEALTGAEITAGVEAGHR
jgi:putative ABC transport system permease protein